MPRKRPAAVRMAELQDKMDNLKLETAIEEMKQKKRRNRPTTRRKR